jgi:thiosulfate dehydrogenase
MNNNEMTVSVVILVVFAAVGAVLSVLFSRLVDFSPPAGAAAAHVEPLPTTLPALPAAVYRPPRVDEAPADIRAAVELGYNIMVDTPKYAGDYVGDRLTCANCHFRGGITDGGRNGGLSLVGVAAKYPIYRPRAKGDVDLIERTNSCFERSMNGKPAPADSPEMRALLAYYQWISKGLPVYEEVPWLGLKPLASRHEPDATRGQTIYARQCASCHGPDGAGTLIGPPLWGEHAYNDGAGMSKLRDIAAFVHLNMPRGNPRLTPEESLDVGAYVVAQPRPHFTPPPPDGGN